VRQHADSSRHVPQIYREISLEVVGVTDIFVRDVPLSIDDFAAFSETFADLGDPEVMKGAWA
jgi:hypothetical protein